MASGLSTDNAIHKLLLKPSNLPLEPLNLLPTIQRPSVMQPQTSNNLLPRPLNLLIHLDELPPSLKLSTQLLNLRVHALPAEIAVDGLVGGGGRRRGRLVLAAREGDARRVEVERAGWVADVWF
jgi:hypothetical protein